MNFFWKCKTCTWFQNQNLIIGRPHRNLGSVHVFCTLYPNIGNHFVSCSFIFPVYLFVNGANWYSFLFPLLSSTTVSVVCILHIASSTFQYSPEGPRICASGPSLIPPPPPHRVALRGCTQPVLSNGLLVCFWSFLLPTMLWWVISSTYLCHTLGGIASSGISESKDKNIRNFVRYKFSGVAPLCIPWVMCENSWVSTAWTTKCSNSADRRVWDAISA